VQQSKQEAIQRLRRVHRPAQPPADELTHARHRQQHRRYFETWWPTDDRVHRDPKTRLMNFRRFIEQVEAFSRSEQRGRWVRDRLVDITRSVVQRRVGMRRAQDYRSRRTSAARQYARRPHRAGGG